MSTQEIIMTLKTSERSVPTCITSNLLENPQRMMLDQGEDSYSLFPQQAAKDKAWKFTSSIRSTLSNWQLFRALGIACIKIVTERRNHAHDYILQMNSEDFTKFDAIVTISGDGIPHEVINGFMKRPDHSLLTLNLGIL